MYIIMLGAPGSGKGTVGKIIAEELNLAHISTGDIFREQIKNKTELGKKLEEYTSKGLLVPDELTIQILEKRLEQDDLQNGAILDGFPRTENQAKQLDKLLEKKNAKVDKAIYLNVPDEDIIERISNRRICGNKECKEVYSLDFQPPKVENICDKCGSKLTQREDDKEEVVKQRLVVYHKNAQEILNYYDKKEVLYTAEVNKKNKKTSKDVAKELVEYFKKM